MTPGMSCFGSRRFASRPGRAILFSRGRPHQVVAAALAAQEIEIDRGYPPLDTWVLISIGLPEENAVARRSDAAYHIRFRVAAPETPPFVAHFRVDLSPMFFFRSIARPWAAFAAEEAV